MAYKNFKLPPEAYNPETPVFWGDRKSEYARLYKVYQKRIARLEAHGYTHHDTYTLNKSLPKPGEVGASDAALALYDVARFLQSSTSTIRGYNQVRAQHVARLRNAGINFVNSKNYESFADFMKYWKENHAIEYDSEKAVQLFGELVKKDIDPEQVKEHFDTFMQNQRELARLPKLTDHGKSADAAAYRKALGIEKAKATRLRNRLDRQAAEKGIDIRDLDSAYWKKNVLALEHEQAQPGWTAEDYKHHISATRRAQTRAKNKRKNTHKNGGKH